MPRRSSRSTVEAAEAVEEETRRNPRRGSAHEKENETKPMEVDDSSEDPAASSDDEDDDKESDGEDIRQMVIRRRKKAKPSVKKTRSSSRTTRFKSSMKEPPSDSVRDLFQGSTTTSKVTKVRVQRRKENDDSSDSSSSDDDDAPPKRKRATRKPTVKSPKSPARRHSRARRTVKTEETSDEEEEEREPEGEEGDNEDLKVQRILASRTETRQRWKEIGNQMNSSEVTDGSRWFQELDDDHDVIEERFLVKWSNLSYMHVSWETQDDLLDQVDGCKSYLSTFFRKSVNGILFSQDDRKDGDYFDPGFCQIDRILDVFYEGKMPSSAEEEEASKPSDFGIVLDRKSKDFEDGTGRQFLIKWECMNFSLSSWEFERDMMLAEVEYKDTLTEYYLKTKKPNKTQIKKTFKNAEEAMRRAYKIFGDKTDMKEDERETEVQDYQKQLADVVFRNGGQLRDYQAEGVAWCLSNYVNNRSCILADEMGLGKTLQTAAFIQLLTEKMHRRGPFLIVVPLSTMSHWQREFVGWTGLNTIIYHGSAEDRRTIREHEFAFPQDRPDSVGANALYLNKCDAHRSRGPWMTKVVVTTPEMLVADDWAELAAVQWEVLVVDEAHRLKNHNSKLAVNLRKDSFSFKHKILLTGTPIQNDVKEFWTLLNFIDPKGFDDIDAFLEQYGEIKSKDKIDELHETIRPYILRRLKEDVEKSVPPKEETLIEVELTLVQKQYYRALYEKNVGFLHKNKKKALDGPSLSNLAMQLRKCCNHLFLLNGVEEEIREQQQKDGAVTESDFLARGSGKLVLLDKLLPRLKENGHRILLFSQFKIMLDILEDYLMAKEMKFERIDGSITGQKRQQAIDRFQDPSVKEPPFVMLLSTRAGGVGINLTSADTCIIFDSDWNPQNDLQAQARCHRIGQTKKVKVYRLLSRKTYEMQMFHMSSLKMGLDQAVLKGFESGASGEGAMTKEEVERLLRHGAYDIFNEDKAGTAEAESNDFVEQDIDWILERRSRKVVHKNTGSQSGAAGGSFSKASFSAPKTPSGTNNHSTEDIDIEDPEFWTKMVGAAPAEVESVLKPRKRSTTNYSEKLYERQLHNAISNGPDVTPGPDASSSDSSSDEFDSSDDEEAAIKERSRWGGQKPQHWKREQAEAVLKSLERHGYSILPWQSFLSTLPSMCSKFSESEIQRLSWSLVLLALCEGAKDDAVLAQKRAERQAEKNRDRDGDILAESQTVAVSSASQDELMEISFKKLWKSNARWGQQALAAAVSYAVVNEPRSSKTIEQADQVDEITNIFYASLWPSLKGRGWKEEATANGKSFTYTSYRFDSPSSVLNEVVRIHPELTNMVIPILNTLEQSRLRESTKDTEDRNRHLSMCGENVNLNSLNEFLLRYSPLQLLSDRKSARRLAIGRRVLSSCYYLHVTNTLVRQAASETEDLLSELLHVDARSALPHPLWTSKHDATLIRAIAKHGWVDREKSIRAITEDPDIKWGFPFELSEESNDKQLGEDDLANLRSTADRAASFLGDHPELIETLKGCNRHLMIESYGLKHHARDGENADTSEWIVDDEMLRQASTNNQNDSGVREPLDLPVKKDMAKRAKTVLQKSIVALESGVRPGAARNSSTPKSGEQAASDSGYAVIDQGKRCCILLAEMVRGIVKGSQTKMAREVRMLCSLAYEEALALQKMFSAENANSRKEDKQRADEMQKIAAQIALAKKSLKTSAIPGKNILRVMLGLEPTPSRNQSEPLFPTESSIVEENVTPKQQMKKEVTRRDDGALGERAIIRALKKAHDKNDGSPCTFTATDEADIGLQLTMIETLILFTFCSEGIPLITDTPALTWDDIGSVLEIAAKDYYQISRDKLNKCRAVLMKLESQDDSDAKAQAAKKVASAEYDESTKEEAAKQAADYASEPEKLAKKSIMLLEKVRRFGFANTQTQSKHAHKFENGLGPKVPAWFGKELITIAENFNVIDGTGKPMCYTTTDLLQQNPDYVNTRVAAYLDKKSGRQVISQIALLGRLRSVFSKNAEHDLRDKVAKAVKNSKKLEDVWERSPSWWEASTIDHSLLMLQRLNEHGFFNVLSDASGFGPADQDGGEGRSLRELGLTKSVIQQRANHLVRELHSLEDNEEMMRMLEERRNRAASKKQGSDKSLAECHTSKSSSGKSNTKRGGGIQTGLKNFFVSTKSVSKKQKTIVLSDNEGESSASESVSTGKRKENSASEEESPSGKKAKKSGTFFKVMTEEGKDDSPVPPSTPENKMRTIVNDDGRIELVNVPR